MLVEHLFCTQEVAGSIPALGFNFWRTKMISEVLKNHLAEMKTDSSVTWKMFKDTVDAYLQEHGISEDTQIDYIDYHPMDEICVYVYAGGIEIT